MKKGGNVSLWLLDTRTFAEDGSTNCYSVAGWDTKSVPLVSSAAKVDAEIKILDSGAKNISGYFESNSYSLAGIMRFSVCRNLNLKVRGSKPRRSTS